MGEIMRAGRLARWFCNPMRWNSGYGYSLGMGLHPSRRWYLGPAGESRL